MRKAIKIGSLTICPDPYPCPKCKNTSWEIKTVVCSWGHHNTIIQCTECGNLREMMHTDKGGSWITEPKYYDDVLKALREG